MGHIILAGASHDIAAKTDHSRSFGRDYTNKRAYPPTQVVLHVDCTHDSASAFAVLTRGDKSSHFGVDGDGVIHQWADPVTRIAWHAGKANLQSVGIDMNSPLKLKYQARDLKLRGRARPIVERVAGGKMRRQLGFFPEQIVALRELAHLLHRVVGIKMVWPAAKDGGPIIDRWDAWQSWAGWLPHCATPTTHTCPAAPGVVVAEEIFGYKHPVVRP